MFFNKISPKPAESVRFHQRVSDGRDVFVAVGQDEHPIGFIELEPTGHIDCFYCCPEHAGCGVGLALYETLETAARERGYKSLFVEASEAARRFFNKVGFNTELRREFVYNGVPLHNYLMRKWLEP